MNIYDILKKASFNKCSDVHITVGLPPVMRQYGSFKYVTENILSAEDTKQMACELLNHDQQQTLERVGEIDLAISDQPGNRYRVNIYMQTGKYSIAIRLLNPTIPSFEALGLPRIVSYLADTSRGLILVTGPTGSGKSTTLACMIDKINRNRDRHIVTLEEPIEYLHSHKKSVVNQREVGRDTMSFATGLRAALRQDPDVILIGEMRDLETITIALTAAETGHLVLSTLHTTGAAKTIDRIIDVFPPHQQQQIRTQLSTVLQGVISQQLIPSSNGLGRVASIEVMVMTPAIRNLIREGKTFQVLNVMQTSSAQGMKSMDSALLELYNKKQISSEDCLLYASDVEYVRQELSIRREAR